MKPATRELLLLGAAVALPRLLVFPLAESWFGDAIVRAELASQWAAAPHPIGSYAQGAHQYGPLHLVLVGAAGWLWPVREHVGRVVSLLCSVLTVWPLHALTSRFFSAAHARVACLAFALWGMHVQFSTTGGSEALGVLLVVLAVAALARALELKDRAALLGSALALTLACATRYDAWLLVPIFMGSVAWRLEGSRRWQWAVLFAAGASAFPAAWMFGNWVDLGDALYPFRYIDQFHRTWFLSEEAAWSPGVYRLQNTFFWPGMALLTLSPLLGAAGLWGVVRSWRARPELRWLVVAIVLPALLFTVRSTILGSFAPLARFTAKELVLVLPFIAFGAEPFTSWLRRPVVALAWALAVLVPLGLGAFTFHREGKWEDMVRPVSPISTQPVALMALARRLDVEVNRTGEALILDSDPRQYRDLTLAFFSGLPETRLARVRWEDFESKREWERPRYLVRFEDGVLATEPISGGVRVNGEDFIELSGVAAPLHLYRLR